MLWLDENELLLCICRTPPMASCTGRCCLGSFVSSGDDAGETGDTIVSTIGPLKSPASYSGVGSRTGDEMDSVLDWVIALGGLLRGGDDGWVACRVTPAPSPRSAFLSVFFSRDASWPMLSGPSSTSCCREATGRMFLPGNAALGVVGRGLLANPDVELSG